MSDKGYKEKLLNDIHEYFESEKRKSEKAREGMTKTKHSDDEKEKIFKLADIHENVCARIEENIMKIIEDSNLPDNL